MRCWDTEVAWNEIHLKFYFMYSTGPKCKRTTESILKYEFVNNIILGDFFVVVVFENHPYLFAFQVSIWVFRCIAGGGSNEKVLFSHSAFCAPLQSADRKWNKWPQPQCLSGSATISSNLLSRTCPCMMQSLVLHTLLMTWDQLMLHGKMLWGGKMVKRKRKKKK